MSDSEPQFLVDGMIEQRSLSLVFGRPASGKSFFAFDVAASISTGEPFQGLKVQKGDVVYIAGEGHRGLRRRFDAWAKHHEINPKDIRVMISRLAVNYRDEGAAKELEEELIEAQKKGLKPSLFVIDTLARNYGDGDENSNVDMSRFIRVIDSFNDKFGCAKLIVHHSGHGDSQRGRGASSLKGALETEFLCAKKDDAILVTCTKIKDFEAPADLYLKLTSVELGTTSNGKPVESAVLTKTNDTIARSTITPSIRRNLRVFCEAANEYGGQTMLNEVVLEYRVSLENWREVFYRRATQDNVEAKRKAFERARKELVNKSILEVDEDIYVLKSPEAGQTGQIPDK
ncbi:helicase RepA family protein [Alphaproteobacteria bacterium]|nr:helicase RepA family protein [Alphaproteobacteria bacterium]